MGNDIERIVEADKREQVQTGYILLWNICSGCVPPVPVGTHFIAERADAPDEIAVCHFECGAAYTVAGVEYRSVSQYDAGGEKHLCRCWHAYRSSCPEALFMTIPPTMALYGGRVGERISARKGPAIH